MARPARPDPRLVALSRLTGALRTAELARLSALVAEADQMRTRIAALELPETAAPDGGLAAHRAAEARYRIWADRKRADLNGALARKMAEIEIAREGAARALGRDEVLGKLLKSPHRR